jgi:hypothetical protein
LLSKWVNELYKLGRYNYEDWRKIKTSQDRSRQQSVQQKAFPPAQLIVWLFFCFVKTENTLLR